MRKLEGKCDIKFLRGLHLAVSISPLLSHNFFPIPFTTTLLSRSPHMFLYCSNMFFLNGNGVLYARIFYPQSYTIRSYGNLNNLLQITRKKPKLHNPTVFKRIRDFSNVF